MITRRLLHLGPARITSARLRCGNGFFGDLSLGLERSCRQPFHGLRDLLAGQLAFLAETGQLPQRLHRPAHRFDQFNPVDLPDHTQGRDDVAHRQVGLDLGDLAL